MILLLFKLIGAVLFAVGLLFILIEWRARMDKTFLYGGLLVCLFSALSGIDIWVFPVIQQPTVFLFWTKAQHVLAGATLPVMLAQVLFLTRTQMSFPTRILVLATVILTAAFCTNRLFFLINGEVRATVLYSLLFIPYTVFAITVILWTIIRSLRSNQSQIRRILQLHLIGISLLFSGGLVDAIIMATIGMGNLKIPSFIVFGALGYGIMLCFAFAERLLSLISDRRTAYDRLEAAHHELESVGPLKQIGESAAIVNHEIKNYMFTISSITEQIRKHEPLTASGKEQIEDLGETVNRLTNFSRNVLSLSRAQMLETKKEIDLAHLVSTCIAHRFEAQKGFFDLAQPAVPYFIQGDEGKLEQVFVNLFTNSLEAAGKEPLRIDIRFSKEPGVILVAIEDNGIGCTQQQLDNLFRAFYTTKKAGTGTGLGLSIAKTIIESHGGKIGAQSKNFMDDQGQGMLFQISFPSGDKTDENAIGIALA